MSIRNIDLTDSLFEDGNLKVKINSSRNLKRNGLVIFRRTVSIKKVSYM